MMNPKSLSLILISAGAAIIVAAQLAAKPLVAIEPLLPVYFPAIALALQPQSAGAPVVPARPALVAPTLPERTKGEESPVTSAPSSPAPEELHSEPTQPLTQHQRNTTVTQPKRPAHQISRDVVVEFLSR